MTRPIGFVIWRKERREASREGRPEASRETRNQEVTSDFPNKSRHRENPRRHDGTHRLCDLGEECREASREGRPEASTRETRNQEVTSDFPNKSRHRENPRRHDGTHRLCDLGEERREASHETRKQGGNFRPRTKTHFPRPRASTYREKTASGVERNIWYTFPEFVPPP